MTPSNYYGKIENPRQKIVEAMAAYYEEHRAWPSIRALSEIVGLRSSSTIASHLRKLELQGVVTHVRGRLVPYELVRKPKEDILELIRAKIIARVFEIYGDPGMADLIAGDVVKDVQAAQGA